MIENLIKAATCSILCGTEYGTAWLIDSDRAVTCRHCVIANIEKDQSIELTFPSLGGVTVVIARIVAQSEDLDTCLLALESPVDVTPLSISGQLPIEGSTWQSFGYPKSKSSMGHRLTGTVAQVLETPILKVDIDLSIDSTVALGNYGGMSGAAIVCERNVVGLTRLKIDGSVAALSLNELSHFLIENGVILTTAVVTQSTPQLAGRGSFIKIFTEAVLTGPKKYVFLEGAHGYGKTTFCGSYQTDDNRIINLGVYHLSDPNSALGPKYRAEPQVFLEWLTTVIAFRLTGKPPRKDDKSYPEQVKETADYLDMFSQYCEDRSQHGMFFIDGLNEIPSLESLEALLGLLPVELPSLVTVVLTAPNYNNLAASLAGKVKTQDVLSLPPLSEPDCYKYCWDCLPVPRRSHNLVSLICDKAKGHALYLRYLIEYVSAQTTDDELNEFPVFTGEIEEYYEKVWANHISDGDAVNLLALMARLRWGLSLKEFNKALNPAEQVQYISVISRIGHLLAGPETTAIYHSSFASFVIEKTGEIDESAYLRLSSFCLEKPEVDYCKLNRIFHLLRAKDSSVFVECNQVWFDNAVALGVEPDALIADVNDVVKNAALNASSADFFRVTFLSQRINFRYDTLFAQSARLIAEALIVLGRPSEALFHVVRLKTLIIDPYEAFEIVYLLHRYDYDNEALDLLKLIHQSIVEDYDNPMELGNYLALCVLHIQSIFLIRLANGWNGMKQFNRAVGMAQQTFSEVLPDDSADLNEILSPIIAQSPIYFLSFMDVYADLKQLISFLEEQNSSEAELPPHHLLMLCHVLLGFENSVDRYMLVKFRRSLIPFFADLAELVQTADCSIPKDCSITDTLIRFSAPAYVVELFSTKEGSRPPRPLKIRSNNGVDVDHQNFWNSLTDWRIAAFRDPELHFDRVGMIAGSDWCESLELLIRSLFCIEGRARRALIDSDEESLFKCGEQLKECVFSPLRFSLQQRAAWQDAYAIPENILPSVYRQLAEVMVDCFPNQLPNWLDDILVYAADQLGLYSEGFRNSVNEILAQLTRDAPDDELSPKLFLLLQSWRDHVIGGVENRCELVPEILRMIPFYIALGAKEEAERLYQVLLSVSMGPHWYKEDQLGIMNKVLCSTSVTIDVLGRLPEIAGYLEKASGEMTFQRYVRDEKSVLLGQIARRGKYHTALAYFRRQICGSTAELWAEAQYGPIDKVGPLQGSRFPGGALEEQSAVLELVNNSKTVSWFLRWALLETFHCGDSRHVHNYAKAYAEIVNEVGATPEIVRRTALMVDAETSTEDRGSLLEVFLYTLRADLRTEIEIVLTDLPTVEKTARSDDGIDAKTEADPENETDQENDAEDELYSPGVFGNRRALRNAESILKGAEKQWNLGNRSQAKDEAVSALQAVQDGGWGIWGGPTAGAVVLKAEDMLIRNESSASDVIRCYANLIDTDQHVQKWVHGEHLIGRVGALLDDAEGQQLLDIVIDHSRLVVGESSEHIRNFGFLLSEPVESNPDIEFFRLFIWLCDHPKWIRRDRAAAMLLWLVDQTPELFAEGVRTAFSMADGYGPDLLCGVLDGASEREPIGLWDKLSGVLDVIKTTQELRHVSRITVLERIATRAANLGSTSASAAAKVNSVSYIENPMESTAVSLPVWADALAPVWSQVESLVSKVILDVWKMELEKLCSPLSISDALALERAVSTSVRDSNSSLDRWQSKLRTAFNLACWSKVSQAQAASIETALRIYNPHQPELFVTGTRRPFNIQLMKAVNSGDFSAALVLNPTLYLNYRETTVNPNGDGVTEIELSCVLQPNSGNSEPIEIWTRSADQNLFFGSSSPALPLLLFQNIANVRAEDFKQENWRLGRLNSVHRTGMPECSGNSLSISRRKLKSLTGLKLVWIVRVNGKFVTAIDERNQRMR